MRGHRPDSTRQVGEATLAAIRKHGNPSKGTHREALAKLRQTKASRRKLQTVATGRTELPITMHLLPSRKRAGNEKIARQLKVGPGS